MSGIIDEMKRVVESVLGDERVAGDVVHALIRTFGGERLYIPGNDYERRNREIRELHSAGANPDQLARRYRLSLKSVYRILGITE